jgi:hypothetical protein
LAISQTRRHLIKPDQTLRNRPIHHHARTNKHITTIGTGSRLDGLTGLTGFSVHAGTLAGTLAGLGFAGLVCGGLLRVGVGVGRIAVSSITLGGIAGTGLVLRTLAAPHLAIGCLAVANTTFRRIPRGAYGCVVAVR